MPELRRLVPAYGVMELHAGTAQACSGLHDARGGAAKEPNDFLGGNGRT